jgi:hypothetical protein
MARTADRSRAAQWRKRLARFESSSLSVARFCQRERISVASFYYWRKKLAEQSPASGSADRSHSQASVFQPVTVVASAPALAVRLPGGAHLEVPAGDYHTVRVVVRELVRSGQAFAEGDASC